MAWYDSIVDWGAEVIGGYEDIGDVDFGFTAGEQFISDVKDFTGMDSAGFIKQGVKAYGMLSGTLDADGNRTKGKQDIFQQRKIYQAPKSYRSMGFGKTGTPQFNVSQGSTMATGAFNPQVQTALTALLSGSNNPQMNNLLGSFNITPNIRQGRQPSTGSTVLARKAKKTK